MRCNSSIALLAAQLLANDPVPDAVVLHLVRRNNFLRVVEIGIRKLYTRYAKDIHSSQRGGKLYVY